MTWSQQAEALLGAVVEAGALTAEVCAAAWRAGVHTDATDSLTGAALALYATPSMLLNGGLTPLPNDVELLNQATDLETAAGVCLVDARQLSDQVAAAARTAARDAEAASRAIQKAEKPEHVRAAEGKLREAQATVSDCEYAMEVLTGIGPRAARACDLLGQVPDDLATAYELPYQHIRTGRILPADGLFLTAARS